MALAAGRFTEEEKKKEKNLNNKYSVRGNYFEVAEFYINIYPYKFKYPIRVVIQKHHGTDLSNKVLLK